MSLEPNGELVPIGGGDPIPLVRDTLIIGRRESCDICLRFGNISSIHCELSFRDGYWYIRDLNSTNGVRVNGVRVSRKLLMPDDEVAIATRRFTIHYTLPAGRPPVDEVEEDIMSQSLLERAGLEKPRRRDERRYE
ncbi:MAG TPA: FHA domain-containing protein [Gemmataceae bacterium]|nr:FHA domain-containing protein [Gemmataceae bacterium]